MASSGVNVCIYFPKTPQSISNKVPFIRGLTEIHKVLRYSALIAGACYGFYHQSSLNAQRHKAQVDRDYQHQASLITQAKAEFKKKNMPPESVTRGGDGKWDFVSLPGEICSRRTSKNFEPRSNMTSYFAHGLHS